MANKDKILTYTAQKVILRWDRIGEVLSKEEKLIMNKMLGKIHDYHEIKRT